MTGYWNNGYRGIGMMGGGSWVMVVVAVLAFALLIFCTVVAIRSLRANRRAYGGYAPHPAQGADSALNILNERYARSEINQDEYNRMKSDIVGTR
jgi:putative membrane protein